ncbi:hypothetical protein J4221_04360 [Candidatus Pacearchaeota archaeon]|nr:hypothetical protein [Candidatus Pacearchaeota archaeon]
MKENLTVDEMLLKESYEGIVVGKPTGMYADRASYGNAPILAFILDRKLPCKIRAQPYSQRYKAKEGESELVQERSLITRIINFEFDDENEKLGIAAAFIDQAIRNQSDIEVHGSYENQLFNVHYLKVENYGFEFSEYKFPFETLEEGK